MKKYFAVLAMLLVCGVGAAKTPAPDPNYNGALEVATCASIEGFADDRNRLNTPITVSIFSGSTLLSTVLANLPRPDIGAAIGDNGLHGFLFATPPALKDGQPHSISVRFESTTVALSLGPRSITCGSPVTPKDDVGTQVFLAVNFKLNNGAASTKQRLVGLNFSVREHTGGTSHDVTADVTHYRAREVPDEGNLVANLSAQPWILITHGLIMELGEHNPEGRRYGGRRVAFQVQTATLTSDVVSDSITLEPVLKDYKVSSQGDTHPLIQYAASQGFKFPLDVHETSCNSATCPRGTGGGIADRDIATGTAGVGAGEFLSNTSASTCVTKASYVLFGGRSPNQYWRIKSVVVPGTPVGTPGPNRFEVRFSETDPSNRCSVVTIKVGDVVVEGPEVDDFLDPANPWKNAFVRPLTLIRPTVQPGIRPPN